MKDYQALYGVIATGILVPVAYALFVIFLTRRGKEFSKMDSFFGSMENLHKSLHRAFIAEHREKPAERH